MSWQAAGLLEAIICLKHHLAEVLALNLIQCHVIMNNPSYKLGLKIFWPERPDKMVDHVAFDRRGYRVIPADGFEDVRLLSGLILGDVVDLFQV